MDGSRGGARNIGAGRSAEGADAVGPGGTGADPLGEAGLLVGIERTIVSASVAIDQGIEAVARRLH